MRSREGCKGLEVNDLIDLEHGTGNARERTMHEALEAETETAPETAPDGAEGADEGEDDEAAEAVRMG